MPQTTEEEVGTKEVGEGVGLPLVEGVEAEEEGYTSVLAFDFEASEPWQVDIWVLKHPPPPLLPF